MAGRDGHTARGDTLLLSGLRSAAPRGDPSALPWGDQGGRSAPVLDPDRASECSGPLTLRCSSSGVPQRLGPWAADSSLAGAATVAKSSARCSLVPQLPTLWGCRREPLSREHHKEVRKCWAGLGWAQEAPHWTLGRALQGLLLHCGNNVVMTRGWRHRTRFRSPSRRRPRRPAPELAWR